MTDDDERFLKSLEFLDIGKLVTIWEECDVPYDMREVHSYHIVIIVFRLIAERWSIAESRGKTGAHWWTMYALQTQFSLALQRIFLDPPHLSEESEKVCLNCLLWLSQRNLGEKLGEVERIHSLKLSEKLAVDMGIKELENKFSFYSQQLQNNAFRELSELNKLSEIEAFAQKLNHKTVQSRPKEHLENTAVVLLLSTLQLGSHPETRTSLLKNFETFGFTAPSKATLCNSLKTLEISKLIATYDLS